MTNQLNNIEYRKFHTVVFIDQKMDSSDTIEPEIQFIVTSEGYVVCNQWNREIENILQEIGKELFPEMSHFCG